MYQPRFYREAIKSSFRLEIAYKESDLLISSDKPINREFARETVKKYYQQIEAYAQANPEFLHSLSPVAPDAAALPIVREMIASGALTGIGPFASVAGAIAMYAGAELLKDASEVIVENGGDIFLKIGEDKRLAVYLGERFNEQVVYLKIKKRGFPFGIASSSAYIGHSLNFGRADLVTVIADNAVLADGFATALSNAVKSSGDIAGVIERAEASGCVSGLLIAVDGKVALWGEMELEER